MYARDEVWACHSSIQCWAALLCRAEPWGYCRYCAADSHHR
jgi:hypothetical protein